MARVTVGEVRNFLDGLSQRGLFTPDMEWRDALLQYAKGWSPETPDELPKRTDES